MKNSGVYKGLGKVQRLVVDRMKEGMFITEFRNYSSGENDVYLSDEYGNIYECSRHTLISLFKRELLRYETVYTTVCPDTATIRFYLK